MERDEAIMHIEALYPTDSDYEDTNEIGRALLARAKEEVEGWRSESTPVLVRYAELCIQKEEQQFRQATANA